MNRAECIERIKKSFGLEEVTKEDRVKIKLILSYVPLKTLRDICIKKALRDPKRATYMEIALTHGVSLDTVKRKAQMRME
jgi:hypothetical protein